jgi:hypothetical protein
MRDAGYDTVDIVDIKRFEAREAAAERGGGEWWRGAGSGGQGERESEVRRRMTAFQFAIPPHGRRIRSFDCAQDDASHQFSSGDFGLLTTRWCWRRLAADGREPQ